MRVADAMTKVVLVVTPHHTVNEAARLMTDRHVGAAVVMDADMAGPGIVTERDILRAVAEEMDTVRTPVSEVMTFEARTATVDWDLDTAAGEMVRNGFRHLIVVDGGDIAGVLSMRDIVRSRVETPAH